MPLKRLADNDELGNNVAHFFKSGNVLRSSENDKLLAVKKEIPEKIRYVYADSCCDYKAINLKVEYDLWYNSGWKLEGFVYTDLLTYFIYIRAASEHWAQKVLKDTCERTPITREACELMDEVTNTNIDKYKLRPTNISTDFVIFLPGTNIMNKTVDFNRVEKVVKQEKAKIKCHPLTSQPVFEHLKHRFGKHAILDKKISGHTLLNNATRVGYCQNSELGILGMLKGKRIWDFGLKNKWLTYTPIYRALGEPLSDKSLDRFLRIISAKHSGFIPYNNPKQLTDFFQYYTTGTFKNEMPNFSGGMRFSD